MTALMTTAQYRWITPFITGLLLLLLTSCGTTDSEEHHWGYTGSVDPTVWSRLSNDFATCGMGHEQSPINIVRADTIDTSTVAKADIRWSPFVPTVINNGHTIQVISADNDAAPMGYTILDGIRYDLLQFHFHHLSEHTVNGEHAPLEVHFVHQAGVDETRKGDLLVIGFLFELGNADELLDNLWSLAPSQPDRQSNGNRTITPANWLSENQAAFRYAGSLTTPPCSEIVTWNLIEQPIAVSQQQIDTFAQWYPHNERPIQPVERRFVLEVK